MTQIDREALGALARDSGTVFGNLVHVASQPMPGGDKALGRAHSLAFFLWLDLPLVNQTEDLRQYALFIGRRSGASASIPQDMQQWLIPSRATAGQRSIFLSDMATTCEILRLRPTNHSQHAA